MACYIISYDLQNEKDYESLYEVIKSYSWAKITESTWAILSEKTASDIRTHLASVMDADDRLFVVKSGGVAAWQNVICSNEWLKNNI